MSHLHGEALACSTLGSRSTSKQSTTSYGTCITTPLPCVPSLSQALFMLARPILCKTPLWMHATTYSSTPMGLALGTSHWPETCRKTPMSTNSLIILFMLAGCILPRPHRPHFVFRRARLIGASISTPSIKQTPPNHFHPLTYSPTIPYFQPRSPSRHPSPHHQPPLIEVLYLRFQTNTLQLISRIYNYTCLPKIYSPGAAYTLMR